MADPKQRENTYIAFHSMAPLAPSLQNGLTHIQDGLELSYSSLEMSSQIYPELCFNNPIGRTGYIAYWVMLCCAHTRT